MDFIRQRKVNYTIKRGEESFSSVSAQFHDLDRKREYEQKYEKILKQYEAIDKKSEIYDNTKDFYRDQLKLLVKKLTSEAMAMNLSWDHAINELDEIYKEVSSHITPWVEQEYGQRLVILRDKQDVDRRLDLIREDAKRSYDAGFGIHIPEYRPIERPITDSFIEFIVLDSVSRRPIKGIRLKALINTASGMTRHNGTTNNRGIYRFNGLPRKDVRLEAEAKDKRLSNCLNFVKVTKAEEITDIDFDNPIVDHSWSDIISIDKHQVADEDRLETIKSQFAIGLKAMLAFNFGISDLSQVEKILPETVGCHQTDSDGKTPKFSTNDVPGLIYIPKDLETSELSVNKTYIVETEVLGFSDLFYFCKCT